MMIRGAERFAHGSGNAVDARDYDRLYEENQRLRAENAHYEKVFSAIERLPDETSAFPGLKSMSLRPDLPLVDFVMTFDSLESAQAARSRISALVCPAEKASEPQVYTQEALDEAHERTRQRLAKLKVE